MTLLIPLLAFVFVSLLVAAAAMMFTSSGALTIEQRLGEVTGTTPRVADSSYEKAVIDGLKYHYREAQVDVVLGIEARGFIFAPALAYALGAGFVPWATCEAARRMPSAGIPACSR